MEPDGGPHAHFGVHVLGGAPPVNPTSIDGGERAGQDHPLASLPWVHVNEWNGLVLRYEPDHGSVDWHRRYERGALQAPPPPIAAPARLNQKPWWQWPAPRGRRRLAG